MHKVGGEVDAFCTRCRMALAHTILAMVEPKIARVRCNTCGGDHAFRSEPGARMNKAPSAPRAGKPRVVIGFEQQLQDKDLSKARAYSPQGTFLLDEVVNHPTFGLGLVTAVRGDKLDVAFKAAQKTLVHGRGGEPVEKPVFHPPSAVVNAPADKPTVELPVPTVVEAAQDEDAASV